MFIIVLENENESTSFGPGAPSPYLANTLPSMGVFLPNYYGIGHASLDNYVAMVSGQAPDPQTQADCGTYQDFTPTQATLDANGQATGSGCVYPASSPSASPSPTSSPPKARPGRATCRACRARAGIPS